MKTLYLSIITILLIGISFFAGESVYGCLGNCPPIIPPPHYTFTPITVNTNLENYSTGDNIVITGHVFNQTKNTPLIIKIFDPIRQFQFDKNVPVSTNGNYTWTLSTVNFWSFDASGNYTVLSQYGQVYAITSFNLNSTLTQYLYSQSPLLQFRNGMAAQDVHCHAGLDLILKKENLAPACVHTLTATNLILSGWAIPRFTEPFIEKFAITGLQQNYAIGQTINATVTYSGYYRYVEPEVKILDANGTQVWFNCPYCYTRSELARLNSFDTFTYIVRDYVSNKLPVINKTGTYTMVASLDNKTANAEFAIVKPSMPHGITALIIYHPPDLCLSSPSHSTPSGLPSCPPNKFYLKINSNSTAYLMGYNICDGNSCAVNNTMSLALPLRTGLNPEYQMIGLPVNLPWKYGDTVEIQLYVSPTDDDKTASLLDLGDSKIVP